MKRFIKSYFKNEFKGVLFLFSYCIGLFVLIVLTDERERSTSDLALYSIGLPILIFSVDLCIYYFQKDKGD